jgi:hypothetical protein
VSRGFWVFRFVSGYAAGARFSLFPPQILYWRLAPLPFTGWGEAALFQLALDLVFGEACGIIPRLAVKLRDEFCDFAASASDTLMPSSSPRIS